MHAMGDSWMGKEGRRRRLKVGLKGKLKKHYRRKNNRAGKKTPLNKLRKGNQIRVEREASKTKNEQKNSYNMGRSRAQLGGARKEKGGDEPCSSAGGARSQGRVRL